MFSFKKSGAALLVAAGVSLGVGVSPAQAQTECGVGIIDYEGSAVLSAQPTSVAPGETIVLSGTGYPPNTQVPLLLDGASIGVATTDDTGSFTFDYVVPADTTATSGTFATECGTFVLTTSISFSAVDVPTTTTTVPTTPLPTTGSDSGAAVQLGGGLVVGGGLLLLLSRSRRTSGATAS